MNKYYGVEAKVKYPTLMIFYKLAFLLEIVFILILLVILLNIVGILNFSIFSDFIKLMDLKNEQLARQIIFSQVSLSFLILSLLSFLTNLKKDKILGTSIYRIVFAFSIFGNLTMLSLAVFSLLFVNIMMYFRDSTSIVIPYAFLVTMILLAVYIMKIIFYTNNQKKSINKVSTLYYTKNKQIVKNNFIEHYKNYQTPQIIFDLVEDTERKILTNDIEYNINFQVYAQLSNLTLRNFRKKVQENHMEKYKKKDDIITFWIRQIFVLIDCNLLIPATEQYNKLLNVLINNSVFIESHELNQTLNRLLKHLMSDSNTELFKRLENQIFRGMNLTVQYSYFKLNNDFSYTRLGELKKNNLFLFPMEGDFYKNYYKIIWGNKKLSEEEQRKMTYDMIEKIRRLAIDMDNPFSNNFFGIKTRYYDVLYKEQENLDGDLELVGIPLGLLLYEIILREDDVAIYHLLYRYNLNSIYYACLMVVSKLVSQYLGSTKDNEHLKELIKVLSMKLENWDSYKLKLNKIKIVRNEMNDRVYSTFFFHHSDIKSLDYIYQSIQMKRHKVSSDILNNVELKRVYNIVSNDEKRASINEKWNENNKNISEMFFPSVQK